MKYRFDEYLLNTPPRDVRRSFYVALYMYKLCPICLEAQVGGCWHSIHQSWAACCVEIHSYTIDHGTLSSCYTYLEGFSGRGGFDLTDKFFFDTLEEVHQYIEEEQTFRSKLGIIEAGANK